MSVNKMGTKNILDKKEIAKLMKKMSITAIAKKFGVTRQAVNQFVLRNNMR